VLTFGFRVMSVASDVPVFSSNVCYTATIMMDLAYSMRK
jgi:hypothetical protein